MSRRPTGQLDLFAPKPRNFDEAKLIAKLRRSMREATTVPYKGGTVTTGSLRLSRREIDLLMRPLPRITVHD